MTTKKNLLALSFAAVFSMTNLSHANGIPTVDILAVNEAIKNGILMKEQIENQMKQIATLDLQKEAMTGIRNMGKVLKDEAFNQLPPEWQEVYKAADIDKNAGSYQSKVKNTRFDQQAVYALMESQAKQTDVAVNALKKSYEQINGLLLEIDKTTDTKASTDLINRIQVEQIKVQLERDKLALIQQQFLQQEQLMRKAKAESITCDNEKYLAKRFNKPTPNC